MIEFVSAEQRDAGIISEATHFTIVCFLGVGQYDHHERPTLKEARLLAVELAQKQKRNYMIYAVNARGYSAFVEVRMRK